MAGFTDCTSVENKGEKANAGFRTNLIDPDDLQVCRIPELVESWIVPVGKDDSTIVEAPLIKELRRTGPPARQPTRSQIPLLCKSHRLVERRGFTATGSTSGSPWSYPRL